MTANVRWVGQVDHARRCELLAGAVALVNPVRQVEPFGMVNIESLAMGCPVIGPAFGSFPEILEPREEASLTAKNAKNAKGDLVLKKQKSVFAFFALFAVSVDLAVWPQYERHFRKIAKVGTKAGWSSRGQWPRGVAVRPLKRAATQTAVQIANPDSRRRASPGLPRRAGGRGRRTRAH